MLKETVSISSTFLDYNHNAQFTDKVLKKIVSQMEC